MHDATSYRYTALSQFWPGPHAAPDHKMPQRAPHLLLLRSMSTDTGSSVRAPCPRCTHPLFPPAPAAALAPCLVGKGGGYGPLRPSACACELLVWLLILMLCKGGWAGKGGSGAPPSLAAACAGLAAGDGALRTLEAEGEAAGLEGTGEGPCLPLLSPVDTKPVGCCSAAAAVTSCSCNVCPHHMSVCECGRPKMRERERVSGAVLQSRWICKHNATIHGCHLLRCAQSITVRCALLHPAQMAL